MSINIKIISPYGSQLYFLEKTLPYGGAEIRAREIAKSLSKVKKIKNIKIYVHGLDNTYNQTFNLPKLQIININFIPGTKLKNLFNEISNINILIKKIIIKIVRRNLPLKISVFTLIILHKIKNFIYNFVWFLLTSILTFLLFLIFFFNALKLGLTLKKNDQVLVFGVNSFNYYLIKAFNYFGRKNITLFLTSDDNVSDKTFDPRNKNRFDNYKSLIAHHIKVIKNSNQIVCQNSYQRIQILKFFPEKKTIVLKCPVELISIKKSSLKDKIYDFVWIGKIDKIKGFDYLIDLVKQFPDCKFAVCSSAVNLKKNEFDESFIDYENLFFFKKANSNFINKIIEKSKFLINTSIFEGFPNTFLEAMRLEVPLISLNVNPDKIFSLGIGFFANSNKEDFERYINNSSKINSKEYEVLQKNCKAYLVNHHQQKNFNNQILNFFNVN